MNPRFGRRWSDKAIVLTALVSTTLLLLTYNHACNSNTDGPTTPAAVTTNTNSNGTASVTSEPTPEPSSTPPAATPGDTPTVIINKRDCSAVINNPTNHPFSRNICVYRINGSVYDQTLVGQTGLGTAEAHSQITLKAPHCLGLECETTYNVQCDPFAGEECPENPNDTEKGIFTQITTEPCCVEQWIQQEPVRENETEWSDCVPGGVELSTVQNPPTVDCPGHKSRFVDIVTYETNSCTRAVREASRIQIEEQQPCTAQCEQPICHTENFRIDKGFRWKCQNVPPGVPGHWPNHFEAFPAHNDFFGECTENKCYSITN